MTLEEIQHEHFSAEEVLLTSAERHDRDHKLKVAMDITNSQHEPIWLHIMLASGQIAEIYSSLIDYEDDYVELRGGFGIPLRAICDVGV